MTREQIREQILRELDEDFAPYFAINRLLMTLGRNDPEIQRMGIIIDAGLNLAKTAGAVAAGAIVGAQPVAAIAMIFVNMISALDSIGKPSDTILILEVLHQVRQEIKALTEEMRVRIALLEMQLLAIMELIDARFDALEAYVRHQHTDLRRLLMSNAYSVGVLDKKVDALRIEISDIITIQREQTLRRLREQQTWVAIEQTTFFETMDHFRTAAVEDSRKDKDMVGSVPEFTAGTAPHSSVVYSEMNRLLLQSQNGWDRLAPLQEAARLFGKPLSEGKLNNPTLWSVCARDYTAMAQKWPNLYRKYDPKLEKLGDFLAAGARLQQATRSIIAGNDQNLTPDFLLALIRAYNERAARLSPLLKGRVDAYCGADTPLKGYHPFIDIAAQPVPVLLLNPEGSCELKPLDYQFAAPHVTKPTPGSRVEAQGVQFVSGYTPERPTQPDPTAKLEIGKIELSPTEVKKIEKAIPVEFRAAEKMGLGRIRIGYCAAGVGDEYITFSRKSDPVARLYWLVDRGNNIVYRREAGKPEKPIPDDIRKRFPQTIAFYHPQRFAQVMLEIKAEFIRPGDKLKPLPIFTLRMSSDQYYRFGTRNDNNNHVFQLVNSDDANGKGASLQERFADWLPAFRSQLLDGKAIERDPDGVKKAFQELRALIDKTFEDRRADKATIIKEESAAFAMPGGEIHELLNEITGARELVRHFLSLGMGDWLTQTEQGKELVAVARALKTGSEIAKDISSQVERYLNPATRQNALNLLLLPGVRLPDKVTEALRKEGDVLLPPRPVESASKKQSTFNAGLPAFLTFRNLPIDARVVLDGNLLKNGQHGLVRFFRTPLLTPGTAYSYHLRAEWQDREKRLVKIECEAFVRTDQETVIDFGVAPVAVTTRPNFLNRLSRHALVDETMIRLEAFYFKEAAERETVVVPNHLTAILRHRGIAQPTKP